MCVRSWRRALQEGEIVTVIYPDGRKEKKLAFKTHLLDAAEVIEKAKREEEKEKLVVRALATEVSTEMLEILKNTNAKVERLDIPEEKFYPKVHPPAPMLANPGANKKEGIEQGLIKEGRFA